MRKTQSFSKDAEELVRISKRKALFIYGKHEMDQDRKKVINECAMPTTTKGMQSFLGAALFFKSHVGNFSDKSANTYKMTQKSFNRDRSTWSMDYNEEFRKMKTYL